MLSEHTQALAVVAAILAVLLRLTRGSNKFEKNRKLAGIMLDGSSNAQSCRRRKSGANAESLREKRSREAAARSPAATGHDAKGGAVLRWHLCGL